MTFPTSGPTIGGSAGASTSARDPQVGWFRFHFADERWEWSAEVEVMRLLGTAVPTTELVLSHKHPEDRQQVATTLDEVRRHRQSFSTRHRIVDTAGRVHHVIVVADKLPTAPARWWERRASTSTSAPQRTRSRNVSALRSPRSPRAGAIIEQAKGMLMVVYGINAEAAFDLLRWRSQEGNVELRLLAEQVVADFVDLAQRQQSPSRATTTTCC